MILGILEWPAKSLSTRFPVGICKCIVEVSEKFEGRIYINTEISILNAEMVTWGEKRRIKTRMDRWEIPTRKEMRKVYQSRWRTRSMDILKAK